ncbi:hypothetical protein Q5P01_015156 [Channa striata]|uniref:Uncharacterized protein n=1 Tax=Channa striata TaxID=64152 RepID=A0AA88MHZ7_CHASR|nr:hypothetical protein Q5P01_015156 [Channa striata]
MKFRSLSEKSILSVTVLVAAGTKEGGAAPEEEPTVLDQEEYEKQNYCKEEAQDIKAVMLRPAPPEAKSTDLDQQKYEEQNNSEEEGQDIKAVILVPVPA